MTKPFVTILMVLSATASAHASDCTGSVARTGVSSCQNILFNNLESGNPRSATVAVCSKVERRFMSPTQTYSLETYFRVENRNIVQAYVTRALSGQSIDCDAEFAVLTEAQRSEWLSRDLVSNQNSSGRMRVVSRSGESITVTVLDLVPRGNRTVGEARTVTVQARQPIRAANSGIDLAGLSNLGSTMMRQLFGAGRIEAQLTRSSDSSVVAAGLNVESPGLQVSRIRTLGVEGALPSSDVSAASGRSQVASGGVGPSITIRPMITSNVISGGAGSDNVIAAETRVEVGSGRRRLFGPGRINQPNSYAAQTPAQLSGSVDQNGDMALRIETEREVVETLPETH